MYAVQEAMTFPSDQPPAGFGPVRLEQNDVAVLLRSDSLANIMAATNALFGTGRNQAGSLFKVTSIRRGFTGGGFYGQQGLPSKLALAANIPGAKSIPPPCCRSSSASPPPCSRIWVPASSRIWRPCLA